MDGLSLIIPAHNSEKVIKDSLDKYYEAFSKKFKKMEIIVVCNNCLDHTEDICRELSKKIPLKLIKIPQRGKGYALTAGFNNASFGILGFLDADNPFNLEKISKMPDYLDDYHIAIASKFAKGDKKKQDSFQRRMISIAGNLVSRFFFNLNIKDTQAGAKFFRKEVWETLTANNKKFTCNGFDWDIEFLYRAVKKNFKIIEIHTPVQSGKFSTFRLKYIPGMLKRLLILRFIR